MLVLGTMLATGAMLLACYMNFHTWTAASDRVFSGMESLAGSIPSDLRVIVHKNATVAVNVRTPVRFAVGFTLPGAPQPKDGGAQASPWVTTVAVEDGRASVSELLRTYTHTRERTDVVVSGSTMLIRQAGQASGSASGEDGAAVVPVEYRVLDLSREPSIEVPLSLLCEAVTQDELHAAMAAEVELDRVKRLQAAAASSGMSSDAALTVKPRPRVADRPGFSQEAIERVLVGRRRHRRSILYFNETALRRAADEQHVPVPVYRVSALLNRSRGDPEYFADVTMSSQRLLSEAAPSNEQLAVAMRLASAGLDQRPASTRVGLTSAYVCTRDTVSAALAGTRSNQLLELIPWNRALLVGSAVLALLNFFWFAAVVVYDVCVVMLFVYPLLMLAAKSRNTRGPMQFTDILRLVGLVVLPLSWWFEYSDYVLSSGHPLVRGTGFESALAYVSNRHVALRYALMAVVTLITVAYGYDDQPDAALVAPPELVPSPAQPVAAATAAPDSAPGFAPAVLAYADPSAHGKRHHRRHRRRRSSSTSSDSDSSDRSASQERRRQRPSTKVQAAPQHDLRTVLALQQQILMTQASIQQMLAAGYAQQPVAGTDNAAVAQLALALQSVPTVSAPRS